MPEVTRGRKKALLFTVLFHVVLGLSLILGIQFSDYRPLSGPKVDIIQAEVVPARPAPPAVDPEIERQRREREAEERRREEEAERQREVQEKAARERETARTVEREKAEAERKKKAEAEALAAKQKAEEAAAQKKAEADAKRKAEAEAKRKAEAEAKRKAAEAEAKQKAQAEQAARERALQDALAEEARQRELDPLRDAYSAAIAQQITRNWLRPPGIGDELRCEVLAVQTPDGNITEARITRSSGNATFDESVIKAIYKAAPLPQPPRPELFDRELKINFCSTGTFC